MEILCINQLEEPAGARRVYAASHGAGAAAAGSLARAPPPVSADKRRNRYPNNTLIADLSKCHGNVVSVWPERRGWLGSRLKGCWRRLTAGKRAADCKLKRRLKFHMPEQLTKSDVSLTYDDYDRALCILTSDVRYKLHLLLYRRIHAIWILFTSLFCSSALVLIVPLELMIIISGWISLQLLGVFVAGRIRSKLDEMLEKSVAQVNTFFMDHNLMLGVINVGGFLSKSKMIIPMLYFDTSQCREQIESIISVDSRNDNANNGRQYDDSKISNSSLCNGCSGPVAAGDGTAAADSYNTSRDANATCSSDSIGAGNWLILDYPRIGLPTTKPHVMALAQSQLAKKIVLRYSQRWISYFDKRKLMFSDDQIKPRHLSTGKCLCQFIEEHFAKERKEEQSKACCAGSANKKPRQGRCPLRIRKQQAAKLAAVPAGEDANEKEQPAGKEKAQVIDKTDAISSLSRLVSLKNIGAQVQKNHYPLQQQQQQQHHLHINICAPPDTNNQRTACADDKRKQQQQEQQVANMIGQADQTGANNLCLSSLRDQAQGKANFPPRFTGCHAASATSCASEVVNLEMDTDLISRSDELVKKLRLLLELRKNNLQVEDGCLFSSVYAKDWPLTTGVGAEIGGDKNSTNLDYKDTYESNNGTKKRTNNSGGKRFFKQRGEGLLFFGSSNSKKAHQSHHNELEDPNRVHPLEMC